MSISAEAKKIYESELRSSLEFSHRGHFIAIEPVSKSYYVEKQFIDAALAAKKAFPNRKSFVLRIGHEAAFHLGASFS